MHWLEVDLGIEVHPYPGLKRNHQVEGFLGAGLNTWQGYSLGGLLLVPRSSLRGFFNEELAKNAEGLEGGGAETFQAEALAASIDSGCTYFGVSRQTMIKRLGLDSILKV